MHDLSQLNAHDYAIPARAILTFGPADLHPLAARVRARRNCKERRDGAISVAGLRVTLFYLHLKVYPARRSLRESFLTMARGPSRALSVGSRRKVQYLILGLGGFRVA